MLTVDEWRRERWRWHCEAHERVHVENKRRLAECPPDFSLRYGRVEFVLGLPPVPYPVFPDDLRGLTCGARSRRGTPCRRRDIWTCGQCRLHGGLSTGPRASREELQIR